MDEYESDFVDRDTECAECAELKWDFFPYCTWLKELNLASKRGLVDQKLTLKSNISVHIPGRHVLLIGI